MKLFWLGSDVLFSTRLVGGKKFPTKITKYLYFLGMTVFAKIADKFVEGHYVVSEHLINELKPLKLRKKIKILADPPTSFTNFVRKPHNGFNILYYRPIRSNQKFIDWVYGYDVVQKIFSLVKCAYFETSKFGTDLKDLQKTLEYFNPETVIIEVHGNCDMKHIYPYIDFVVRPNRHDGNPRMIMECEQLGIPYYWSKENPDIDEIVRQINRLVK